MCWIAKHLPGTQPLRQLMGHRQFGARVVYGDCLFLTLYPDPVKSAMVLRLGRYRKTDPYVVHGWGNPIGAPWNRVRQGRSQIIKKENDT